MNKIHVFYRHVHGSHNARSRDPSKTRPVWFSHEKCFSNFLTTLEKSPLGTNTTVTVIYDGTELEFSSDFMHQYCSTPRPFPVTIKIAQAGSNMASWHVALMLAKNAPMDAGDLIYFLENDYLHCPNWLEKISELLNSPVHFDYVSLYDHMDKYIYAMYSDLRSRIFVTQNHHWRTAPSTCGTFLVRKKIFDEDIELWAREVQDHYQFEELSANKGRTLLTPIPGLATHCMEGYLSPTIDWAAV